MTRRCACSLPVFSIFRIVCIILMFLMCQSAVIFAQEASKSELKPLPPLPPIPMSPTEKAEKDGTALKMSLKDITELALRNNLDIAIEDTNEGIYQQSIFQAQGPYDPLLQAQVGFQSSKNPNTNFATSSAGSLFSWREYSFLNLTFQQKVKTGGTFTAEYNSDRTLSNISFYSFNPIYSTSTTFTFTQPLRRDFRTDQNRSQIKVANLDYKINDNQFKEKVVSIVADIQSKYWDLVGTIRDYEIKRDSLRLIQTTYRDNRRKVEIGTLAPIAVVETQSNLAQREGDLIQAEQRVYTAENQLLTLISSDRKAEIWSKMIIPTETPDFREYKVDLGTAVDTALKNRPELERYDIKMQQYDIKQQAGENKRRWQFNLQTSFGMVGNSSPQDYMTNPLVPAMRLPLSDTTLVGSYGKANKLLFTGGFNNWKLAFNVEVPFRNRSANAEIATVKIQKNQNMMNRKKTEMQIQTEIRNAVRDVDTNQKLVESAAVRRSSAEQQLIGEQKRFEAGETENFRVLQGQDNFALAQFTELQTLIAYKKAIITLQKAMYTLLESSDFAIVTKGSGNPPSGEVGK
jgi:outer membrane protein